MSGSAFSSFSTRSTTSCVALIEALCGSVRLTSSSGRSDAGKNCCCTKRMPNSDSSEQARGGREHDATCGAAHVERDAWNQREKRGVPCVPCLRCLSGRMNTPISGVNSTATIQETSSAMPTTANSEKQYSPAPLWAKPIGMKPAIVTRVPVSIGKAVEV